MRAIRHWRLIGPILVVALTGCRSTALPSLLHPGPIEDQQLIAEKSGDQPPQVIGSPGDNGNGIMPPGYTPRAEAQQSRNVIRNPWFQPSQSYYRANSTPPSDVYRPGLFPSPAAGGGVGGASGAASFY